MARTVSVKLMADVSQYTREIGGRAVAATKTLHGELEKTDKRGKLDRVGAAVGGLSLGLVGLAGVAVKMSADFQKQMSGVAAATHAPAGELEKLRRAALQAGKDTQFSATQAAQGITELSKAGVSTADVLGGGLKGALDLAAAGQLSVGEAADTAANAMTQFGLKGAQVPHIADLLAAGAGKAQGSVHDMGMALNQSGLVAHQFGLSVEDTTGTLAAFASAGLIGQDAGTSFKQMLLSLANPSKKTREAMEELGISAYDAQGKFIGISGLAGVLRDKLKGLTQEQRNATLAQIFGTDAIRAASVLYDQGADGIQKWIDKTNDQGYAAQTARIQTNNLAGDLERLKGSLETLAIQSGSGANGGLRMLAKAAEGAVNAFAGLPGPVQQTITVLSGISGAGLLAAGGFVKARNAGRDFMTELAGMGPKGAAAASGIGKIASVAGKLGLVGAAAVGVYEGFKLFGDWVERKNAPVKANIDDLTESIREFAATGRATGELASKYGANLQQIGQDVAAVTKGMADLKQAQADVAAGLSDPSVYANWDPIDPQVVQRVKDLDTALSQLVKGGGASQARIFLQQLAASGKLTGAQFQQLVGMLPNYTAAAGSAATANTGLAKGFGTAAANAKTLSGKLEDAVNAGQSLTDTWNMLHGALLSTDRAMLEANNAIGAVKKSFKENSAAIQGNSDKALKNRIAVGEAAKAAAQAAQSKYEETNSVKAANDTYNHYIAQLRRTLIQSGLTKAQADKLLHSYAQMPPSIATHIKQPGMPDALTAAHELWKRLKVVDGKWNVNIATYGDKAALIRLRALNIEQNALKRGVSISASAARALAGDAKAAKDRGVFAAGGWTGPGSRYQEAGVVHADEFVMNKPARRSLEAGRPGGLDYMNRTGRWPGYADGGHVWPFPVNASVTKIPSRAEVLSRVLPAGGRTDDYIVGVVGSHFPGLHWISKYRAGARTLTGHTSYHALHRAVDFPPSHALAAWWHDNMMGRTKELITPWNSLNIRNGHPHRYSGAVWRQHNFAGGNAHDHIAMAGGGVINEPVYGFGASGRSYSFAERGSETVIPGTMVGGGGTTVVNTINLTVPLAAGANPREAGRQIAEQLKAYIAGGGSVFVRGQKVLG